MLFWKKAQLSIFILIGVVAIVAGVALVASDTLFKDSAGTIQNEAATAQFQNSKEYIDSCLEKVLEAGVQVVSAQGGYFNSTKLDRRFIAFDVPYYWDGENSYIPDKTTVETELENFVKAYFYMCLQAVSNNDVVEVGFEIEYPDVDVVLSDYDIKVNAEIPIRFSYDTFGKTYSKFGSSMSIDMNRNLDLSKKIIAEHRNDPYFIPLSFLNRLAYQEGFTYEVVELDNNDVLYTLKFDGPSGDAEDAYSFVVKYKEFEG